jgi:transcriptional regulator of arginine metabolism
MKERQARLKAIRKIIKEQRIESQEVLLTRLLEGGYEVTQATLSRDLKLLKIGKISDGWHGYYYSLPKDDQPIDSEKNYIQDVRRGFLSIEFSRQIGVIHTLPGHANSVAFALDRIALPEVLGCVAGDDTILLVLREGATKEELLTSFREKIPEVDTH